MIFFMINHIFKMINHVFKNYCVNKINKHNNLSKMSLKKLYLKLLCYVKMVTDK